MFKVFYQRGAERIFVDDTGEASDAPTEYFTLAQARDAADALTQASRRSIGGDGRRYFAHGTHQPRQRARRQRPSR